MRTPGRLSPTHMPTQSTHSLVFLERGPSGLAPSAFSPAFGLSARGGARFACNNRKTEATPSTPCVVSQTPTSAAARCSSRGRAELGLRLAALASSNPITTRFSQTEWRREGGSRRLCRFPGRTRSPESCGGASNPTTAIAAWRPWPSPPSAPRPARLWRPP